MAEATLQFILRECSDHGAGVLVRLKFVVSQVSLPGLVPSWMTGTVAETVYGPPAVAFAVKVAAVATPFASVIAVVTLERLSAKVPLAPVEGAVKVTSMPTTGEGVVAGGTMGPSTVADSVVPKSVLTVALCPSPVVEVKVSGVTVLTTVKIALEVGFPGIEAVTINEPAVPFEVNAGDTACPVVASVVAVADVEAPAKVPLAPPAEGVTAKTTPTPPTGVPLVVTAAVKGET